MRRLHGPHQQVVHFPLFLHVHCEFRSICGLHPVVAVNRFDHQVTAHAADAANCGLIAGHVSSLPTLFQHGVRVRVPATPVPLLPFRSAAEGCSAEGTSTSAIRLRIAWSRQFSSCAFCFQR